jgi:hypothetical protein
MRNLGFMLVLVTLAAFVSPAPVFADTAPASLNLGISNPGPGGGSSGSGGAGRNGNVSIQALPVPMLTSISPKSVAAGSGNVTLTLSGNGFSSQSSIMVGPNGFAPASATATSLVVVVPASALVGGNLPVSVINPAPGGGTSGALALTVTAANLPAPSITSISPAKLVAGSGGISVTLTGTGFITGRTTVTAAGQAGTVTSPTSATVALSAAVLASAGTISIAVANPSPGGGTAAATLSVVSPPPTVTGFSPTSVLAGTAAANINVTGSNFSAASIITFAGTPVSTTFKSSTLLTGTLTSSFLQSGGNYSVGALNPAPGGGSAAGPGSFSVSNPMPALQFVSPAKIPAGSRVAATVMLSGTGFTATTITLSGNTPLAVKYASSTSVLVSIPPSLLQTAGSLPIVVTNPGPGGGASKSITLLIGS